MTTQFTHAIAIAAVALAASPSVGCSAGSTTVSAASRTDVTVKRGEYLVSVVGCTDCHTPMKMGPKGPEPDMSHYLSGHPEQMGALPPAKAQGPWLWAGAATNTAFAGPWGISYAANLTPDRNTGLGIWDEAMFIKAIRTGRHMGASRDIMPPMPWPAIRNASDEDLKAIFAYLRSLEPVTNHVPDVQPPSVATAAAK